MFIFAIRGLLMRIFVTGPTCSGKTTLARQISVQTLSPLFSLDDIHWIRDPAGDRRRNADECLSILDQIAQQDDWVIEGCNSSGPTLQSSGDTIYSF
jgi:adenylate kinase family enzyme